MTIPDSPEHRKLNDKQEKFVQAYVDGGGNTIQAYRDAGYCCIKEGIESKWIKGRAYSVLRSINVQAAIQKIKGTRDLEDEAEKKFSLDWLRAGHMSLMAKALERDDLTNAFKNLEAVGKTKGFYTDILRIDTGEQAQLSEHQVLEAKRLAELLVSLSIKQLPEPDVVDADVIEIAEEAQSSTLEQSSPDNGILAPNLDSSPLQSIVEPLDSANTMDQSLAPDDVRD